MGSNITAVFTSCARHDLLKETLDSFIRVNCGGAKPDATIIIEDGNTLMPEWLRENIHYYSANVGKVTWIQNEGRRGQIYSIDRAYAQVKTDYIFHAEDDWVFQRGNGFMQQSKALLEKYPSIIQVSLRGNTGWHQLVDQPPYEGCKIAMPYWRGGWGGISFNPGLRRLSDYKRIGSYGRHVAYGSMGLGHEMDLSRKLLDMGYRIADLGDTYVTHSGGARSTMKDPAPQMAKILIGIPVCHKFSYGKWEGDHTNACVAKDYHFSADNDRVQAVRDTWLKDAKVFPNVTVRFFYGQPTPDGFIPQDDEVILSCADDYASLPEKTIEICKYAQQNEYDLLFKCDDDTGVYVDRVLQESMCGIWDYAGYLNGRVCTGGTGYWLTKRAINVIADHATPNYHWAEDVSVSHFLFQHNIQGVHLEGHRTGRADHWFWKDGFDSSVPMGEITAFHAVRPSDMRAWYKSIQGGK
ncbi:MAG: hypothetical protein WAU89_13455 [Candidatus Acidiferrales bacterium]